jgi:NAD(P) transhydrogenase subunit beta
MTNDALGATYLLSAVLFILGLKGLTSPATARRGNYAAMAGMVIAVVATLASPGLSSFGLILAAVVIGGGVGIAVATKIRMTAMPQLVAALHSFVGLAAVLVAVGTYLNHAAAGDLDGLLMIELVVGTVIGAITFTGSVVAFAKLQALIGSAPLAFKGQHWLNLALFVPRSHSRSECS